ncbi:MAG: complex I subunit 5 family protein [bacterium]
MEAVSADVQVVLLLLAPLTAALISLTGKVFPKIPSAGLSFIIWLGASAWTLWQTAGLAAGREALRYAVGGWPEPFGIILELNGISWLISLLAVVIVAVVWSATYRQGFYSGSFYLTLYLTHFSLQGILFSRDLFNLFVWFEVLSLCSIILVAYDRRPRALLAALRYLLLSTISIVFYLLGLWILYTHTGSLAFSGIGAYIGALPAGAGRRPAMVALGLISAGVLTRSAVIPFHTWLPPAHSSAPFPVSALLSSLVIKVPLLALWHFFLYLPFIPLTPLLLWLGLGSALTGGAAALLQSDAKRILAYSSVGQMGFILTAFAAGNLVTGGAIAGVAGAATLFYILMHATSKALLFLSVGYVTHTAGSRDVHFLRGMQRRFPLTALYYWIAALTLMGLPLSGGYFAKVLVSSALYGHIGTWILTVAGAFTAAALFKLGRIFTGRAESLPGPPRPSGSPLLGMGMTLAAAICVAIAVLHQELFCFLTDIVGQATLAAPGSGLSGAASDLAWLSDASLIKAAATTLIGFLGLFALHAEVVARFARRLTGLLTAGLDRSLQLLSIGLLIFVLYSALVL